MKVVIKVDRQSIAATQKLFKEFERLTGKGVEQGIAEIGLSVGRRLAHTVQPYGTNSAKGKSFEKSIGTQVDRAWFGTNLGAFPVTNDMKQAHYSARRHGVVPKRLFRKEKGKQWLGVISEPERDRYKKEAQSKAGRAKAAWVEAANKCGAGKVSGMAKWISRHIGRGYGDAEKAGKGLKQKITLNNRTPYLTSVQNDKAIKSAIKTGMERGYKRMQIIIDKMTAKLSKA